MIDNGKLRLPASCLCGKCGLYKLADDPELGGCPITKMAVALEEGGDCPACGAWIEPQARRERADAEWDRVQAMSEEECRSELEEAGIDVDKGLESTATVVKLCIEVNALKEGLASEKRQSASFYGKIQELEAKLINIQSGHKMEE